MLLFIALFPVGLLAVVMLLARLERGLPSDRRVVAGPSRGAVTATPAAGAADELAAVAPGNLPQT